MDNLQGTSGRLTPAAVAGSLGAVQDVFRRFRTLVLERAGKVAYTDKHDGSPVTDTDMEIEVALQAELAHRFPGVPVFGEETGYGDNLPPAFWLIDPIDGTKSFIEGVPTFTSMAVLIQDGEALASVIYNPTLDDMYTAQKGGGAYKNNVRLDLSTVPLPRIALCKRQFIGALNGMLETKGIVCEQAPSGGGFGFVMVLDGQAAARFNMHGGGYTHDYAPGALLVREAGGVLLPILEDTYTYETRSFVACHPALESTIRPHLAELRSLETTTKR